MNELLKTREERVLRLTLNCPQKNNLLTSDLSLELLTALEDAAADSRVGCILLDASGPIFCGGLDMEEMIEQGAQGTCGPGWPLFSFGLECAKPIVAAVQGPCLGAGVGLAANAHVVVAAQGAKFGLTEIRYGFWPFAAHKALALAIGERRVAELSLTGRIFGAQEAQQFGLVQEIAPAVELDDRVTSISRHLAAQSPNAIANGLEFLRRSSRLGDTESGALAVEMMRRSVASADFAEGVRAMGETRKPKWPSLAE